VTWSLKGKNELFGIERARLNMRIRRRSVWQCGGNGVWRNDTTGHGAASFRHIFTAVPVDKRTFKNVGTTPAAYQVFKVISDKSPKQAGA